MVVLALAILSLSLPVGSGWQNSTGHAHTLSPSMPQLPGFLQKSKPCGCSHKDVCSCESILEFMSCIKDGCESGDCKCMSDDQNHFQKACHKISAGCYRIDVQCTDSEATCGEESVRLNLDRENDPSGKSVQVEKDVARDNSARNREDNAERSEESDSKEDVDIKDRSDSKQELPDGWEKVWSDGERRYYYANEDTGESSWTPPPTVPQNENSTFPATGNEQAGVRSVSLKDHDLALEKLRRHEHQIISGTLVATILVLSASIALLSSSNQMIIKGTWSTLDLAIVSFLALLGYHLTMKGLDHYGLKGGAERFITHIAILLVLLLVSSVVSWLLKRKSGDKQVAIFNSIFDHILVWCAIGVATDVQGVYKSSVVHVLWATFALAVFFTLLGLFWYIAVERYAGPLVSEGSVNKIVGIGLAAAVAFWAHMLIAGSYHSIEYVSNEGTSFDRLLFVNFVSLVFIPVAVVCAPIVKRLGDRCKDERDEVVPSMYFKKRLADTLLLFFGWLPHYSLVLSLGTLIVHYTSTTHVEAMIVLALVNSAIGTSLIVVCAKVKWLRDRELLCNIFTSLGGFMAGTAWGSLLIHSVDTFARTFESKFITYLFLILVIFPVYYYSFKPAMLNQTTRK